MDVSGQILQAMLTRDAKITSAYFLSEVIFALGGSVSALSARLLVAAYAAGTAPTYSSRVIS